VADHIDDLVADFRVFYGIDLRDPPPELTGPEFFSLARRVFAFDGVMAARWRAENEPATPATTAAPQTRRTSRPPQQPKRDDVEVVSLDAMRAMFPGLISHTQVEAK
jgi:hypothetical protein